MDLETLKRLSGINNQQNKIKENPSITGTEKAQYQRKHNIKPGSPEWFKLWFRRPYLQGPYKFRGRKK